MEVRSESSGDAIRAVLMTSIWEACRLAAGLNRRPSHCLSQTTIMTTTGEATSSNINEQETRRESILHAAEVRSSIQETRDLKTLARIHESKQHFRRLLDPGIARPNNTENAELAIKVNDDTITVEGGIESCGRLWRLCRVIFSRSPTTRSSRASSSPTLRSRSA